MATNQNEQLKQQIEADPRVQQLAKSRQRGSMPGVVTADELRRLGYNVTDDGWKYFASPLAKFGKPRVIDENDKYDRIIMAAALGVMTGGIGMELAAGASGASAGSAASEVAGVDATVGGMGAGGWGTAAGATGTAGTVAGAVRPTRDIAQEVFGAFGAGAASYADAAAANRGARFDAGAVRTTLQQQSERDYNDSLIRREEAGREKSRNAWDQMNRASYVVNSPHNLNRTMLSPYSKSLQGPDAFVREQAAKYGNRSAVELDEGNTMPNRIDAPQLEDAESGETAANIGAVVGGVSSAWPWWRYLGRYIS